MAKSPEATWPCFHNNYLIRLYQEERNKRRAGLPSVHPHPLMAGPRQGVKRPPRQVRQRAPEDGGRTPAAQEPGAVMQPLRDRTTCKAYSPLKVGNLKSPLGEAGRCPKVIDVKKHFKAFEGHLERLQEAF